jgi:glycosyltransferase involved in cell wall biosynthesis
MIVVNMWFIKGSNGLFHYGLDYIEALGTSVREVWVRNQMLANAVAKRVPSACVRVLTARKLIRSAVQVHRRGDLIFTPSPHPLGFLRRQVVVVHDSFPFLRRGGAIKLGFFWIGLALSGSAVAYINRADGYRFLQRCRLDKKRMHYLPNRVGDPATSHKDNTLSVGNQIVVGLFGSDSPKKNYEALFAALRTREHPVPLIWRIYGHPNAYTDRLQATYSEFVIEVIPSDKLQMHEFIRSIDIAASAAEGEGFARPVALALISGVPTFLLDTPVFREFYAASAYMFETPMALVESIVKLRPGHQLNRPRLVREEELRSDFEAGAAWLKAYLP